ncbi:MAG TPA: tyrosine--tRNA ligase [Anaerolineae bacterium]|nr:tyrosine--tRNA ligase [Anaerolineae bacterium]
MAFTLDQVLSRGVAEIITEQGLRARIAEGKPLRLKMGFDPSRPLLTIGNMVGIRKLRQFQELGHQVILIVGDWTAQIGDPSGRDETRKMLTHEQTQENARTFMDQFFKVVDRDKTEVRWQSEWFGKFTLEDVFHLAKSFTLADMMEHETFEKRWRAGQPLTMIELLYPALQAYDSVAIDADVEFGGTDQKFNILAGRQLQERRGKRPQEVFLVPLLPGTDGNAKMGKSLGNTIDVYDTPFDMFGKVMSLADSVLPVYLTVASDLPTDEVEEYKRELAEGRVNPRDIKLKLAYDIVRQFHGADAARQAEEEFIRVFSKRELPSEMETFQLTAPMPIVDLLVAASFAPSKSEARRLIQQGGVKLNDEKIDQMDVVVPPSEGILSVGRRKFVRLVNGQ